MRKYEVRLYNADIFDHPFETIRCHWIAVEGGSIIFYDIRRTEPKAIFPASKFYVLEVENA